jgi:NADPH:quinone reductase-like Zn-dependent oxidoreductase
LADLQILTRDPTEGMRVLKFEKAGFLDELIIREAPIAIPAAGEVLVKVKAAAIPWKLRVKNRHGHLNSS